MLQGRAELPATLVHCAAKRRGVMSLPCFGWLPWTLSVVVVQSGPSAFSESKSGVLAHFA